MQVVRGPPVLAERDLFNRARFQNGSAKRTDGTRHTDDRMRGSMKQDMREGRFVRMKVREGAGDKREPEG